MKCTPVKVDLLTEEEALTLFRSIVVGNDTVLAPDVEEIAAKIAEECACLPLAIVTLAGSCRALKGTREWRNALDELISSTKDASDDVSKVFERLKFSYSRLGNKVLQDCFLYCSLYPEDHDIPVKELIEYWIAEGLIAEMNSVDAKFNKGHAILGKLTSRCLLNSFTDGSGGECVRMHDLIRDMALIITASSPRFMVKAGERLGSVPYEDWSEDLERISFMHSWIRGLPVTPPVCPRLTTLLLSHIHNFEEIPDSFFTYMCCLEVLDLSNNSLKSLPESISNLENLHALLLEDCYRLADMPSLKKLKALKVFKLTQSKIEELPEGIEELINLRKLDLSYNRGLGPFPSWKLRRLSKLQYLRTDTTKIQVSVEDLLCLKQLKVVAVHFHNVQELNRYVRSQQFQGMEKYRLIVGKEVGSFAVNLGNEVVICPAESVPFGSVADDLVLPANVNYFHLFEVHDLVSLSAIPCWNGARDLRACSVKRCNGLECIFSEDGQISLGTVESLSLDDLPRFRVLFDRIAPPHNIYSNLKELSFWACPTVKNIFPVQFLQNFPNLESLRAYKCNNLEDIVSETAEMSDWGDHEDDSNTISLPKLKGLYLGFLPSLKSIYNGMMVCHSIEEVEVRKCPLVRRLPLSLHMDSEQATAPPSLKDIMGEDKWWESLVWDDPRAKQILQPFQRQPGTYRFTQTFFFLEQQAPLKI
ncbi:hypothetical protein C3L33_22791, partial [Rhododendron williamsianum]